MQYEIIAKLIANILSLVIACLMSTQQSAFVKAQQYLDKPLMTNEIVNWAKKNRRQMMIFKIDFA